MKICLVCSHGGHLTEMIQLESAFKGHETVYLTYKSERTSKLHRAYLIDNFAEKPFSIFSSIIKMISMIRRERPKVIISTGAEIAIPAFLLAKLFGIRTIFIESCARVNSPSGTGRSIYPISSYFFVQWESLLPKYGRRGKYAGGLL